MVEAGLPIEPASLTAVVSLTAPSGTTPTSSSGLSSSVALVRRRSRLRVVDTSSASKVSCS